MKITYFPNIKTILLLIIPVLSYGQWIERQTPNVNLEFVYFLNDSVGYCGNNYVSYHTTDSGWTWQNATGAYAGFKKACFTSGLNGFAISNTEIFQTSDGGITWATISDSLNISEFYHLEERNGQVIVNGWNPSTGYFWYVSANEGQTWQLRNHHPTRSPRISHILDENHFFLADPQNHTIAASADGGYTWDTVHHQVYVDDYLTSIFFSSPDSGVIGYQSFWGGGWIERTYAGIHNFQRSPMDIDTVFKHGVYFLAGNKNTVCGGGEDGFLYCSPNRGENWFLQPISANDYFKTLKAAYFHDEERIVVTGYSGRVLLTNTGIYPSLRSKNHINNPMRLSIYPNPFSDFTTIELNTENTKFRVINSLGQICLEKENLSHNSIRIERSELPSSGIYLVQIFYQNQHIETRKLVVAD
ncbi:MAG: T9SS type A sorting domain-containing protein [Cryomorphaceae bacterium]|nr:T9SS type A sorting domain-containing protein [Cryomorphaceae bacterium]